MACLGSGHDAAPCSVAPHHEPVLTEAFYLLPREGCDADELFALAEDG